ncbi:MAG TPA: glycosyltransferase family 4 protein [Gemmatimonadales bacterium]|nr:glycosyltransferase family 4 protein [Gemmatimonadales bacterium]
MRVVFVTHNYPRWPGDLSGSFLATLAQGLVRRGHEVRVIAPSDAGKGGRDEQDGIPVERVRYAVPSRETLAYSGRMQEAANTPGGLVALVDLWRAFRRAIRAQLRDGADVVHAHWWIPAGLALPRGVASVLTSHGTDAALLRRSALARSLARPVFRRAKVVTAVSKELVGWIQDATGRHIPKQYVQPMPVDTTDWPWTEGDGGAITIARLVPQKRVHLAVEAIAALKDLGNPMGLTVVGDGPERPALESLASRRGVADLVHFAGRVPPEQIPAALARAEIMLLPAQAEGFGLAAAEALMVGVPVIGCWDGGGLLDVIPQRGPGRLTLPVADAIADAVLGVLNDTQRFTLARSAGEVWRARLAPDHVASVYEGWYREARGE